MIKLAVFKKNINIIMQVTILYQFKSWKQFPNINEDILHYDVKFSCCLTVATVPRERLLAQLFTYSMKRIALASTDQ